VPRRRRRWDYQPLLGSLASQEDGLTEIRSCVLILLLTLLLQACTTARTQQRHFNQALTQLEQSTDADSLAAAAVLSRFTQPRPHEDAVYALLVRAVAAAPQRADLAWLSIGVCRDVPACDPEPEVDRLRALDPSNGAGWLNAVARANAADDEAAKIAALSQLARAERVDVYWTTLIVHLTRALVATHEVPLKQALVDVIGIVDPQALPNYMPTLSLCKGERLNNDEVLQDCRRVALAFERGDTFITEMIGLAIARRAWPADSPEWKAAEEETRVARYRMRTGSTFALGARWARQYLSLCEQNRREQDVHLAEIIRAGKSPDPPPE
jgi:hypothetical protein